MNAYAEDLPGKITDVVQSGMFKSKVARLFGVSLSSVQRYARMVHEGRPLSSSGAPEKRLKIDERGRRLLEADLKERPAATLAQRCWFLKRIAVPRYRRCPGLIRPGRRPLSAHERDLVRLRKGAGCGLRVPFSTLAT